MALKQLLSGQKYNLLNIVCIIIENEVGRRKSTPTVQTTAGASWIKQASCLLAAQSYKFFQTSANAPKMAVKNICIKIYLYN
ncbi:hypothetical protein, partial [uncultured Bacteroides sp.]|uniref:hypothetical protein n=1 Tax=uncultured Bacteroides sp. TaxID=162156 RepID=UPI0025F6904D